MFYELHPVYISINLYYNLDPIQHQILRSFTATKYPGGMTSP